MKFDLVFEGGGVRGVAFIGALEAFARNGHTIGRVMGTSVGGLTAALLATGHDVQSIKDIHIDPATGRLAIAAVLTPYPRFTSQIIRESATRKLLRDTDVAQIPNLIEESTDTMLARFLMSHKALHPLFSILEQMSLYDDHALLDWLVAQFNAHAHGEDWASLGLAALYERTGKSVTVIASDITDPTMLVLNHSTAPHLPLKWAVRMTIGVPYLLPPVPWQSEWGLYRQRRLEGHLIVDGGVLSQFPIELFLSPNEDVQAMMGPRVAGDNVIGLMLDENQIVPGYLDPVSPNKAQLDAVPGLRFSRLLINTLLNNASSANAETLKSHVIHLPVRGVHVYDFAMNRQDFQPVINAAYNITHTFLNGWRQQDPRALLTTFEKKYIQVIAEKFVVSGDYYKIGDVMNSSGIAIGQGASATVNAAGGDEESLDSIFSELRDRVEGQASPLAGKVGELQAQMARGVLADDLTVAGLIDDLARGAPATGSLLKSLMNLPAAQAAAGGPATQFVLRRL
jgi:predicted acylesterase/phospholipase RssA